MGQDYQKCFENFQWAQQWDPENPLYAYNLGNAYYHIGRAEDSLAWYEKATSLNPRYTLAYGNWAVVALQTGKYDKAADLFRKVLDLNPGDPQAQRGLDYLKQRGHGTAQ
jgi:tetratricopeptide (TPR) repeat protein